MATNVEDIYWSVQHDSKYFNNLNDYESDYDSDTEFSLESNFQESSKIEYDNEYNRNIGTIVPKVNDYNKCSYRAYEQERETTNIRDRTINLQTRNKALTLRPYDKFKTTHRQTRQSKRNGNIGAKYLERGGYHTRKIDLRKTHRESAKLRDYKGNAGKTVSDQMDRTQYTDGLYIQGLKDSTLTSYTPGAGYQHYGNGKGAYNISITQQLSNQETDRSVMNKTHLYTKTMNKDNFGIVTNEGNTLQEYDTRLDPGNISQLNNNPFVVGTRKSQFFGISPDPSEIYTAQNPYLY